MAYRIIFRFYYLKVFYNGLNLQLVIKHYQNLLLRYCYMFLVYTFYAVNVNECIPWNNIPSLLLNKHTLQSKQKVYELSGAHSRKYGILKSLQLFLPSIIEQLTSILFKCWNLHCSGFLLFIFWNKPTIRKY